MSTTEQTGAATPPRRRDGGFEPQAGHDGAVTWSLAPCLVANGTVLTVGIPVPVRHPIANLRAFKDRTFVVAWFQVAPIGSVPCASAVLVPQRARQQIGQDLIPVGLPPAPDALLLIVPIPIISRVMNVPVKHLIAFGGLAVGSALFFSMNPHHATPGRAPAFLSVPISTIAHATAPRALDGAALSGLARELVGGLGISISPSRLVDHPFPGSQMLQAQSAVPTCTEVFLLTGCAAFLFIPAALMLSGARPRPSGGGH